MIIPTGGVRTDLMGRAANVDFPVAGDVEMITDAGKAALQMAAEQCFYREVAVTARCAAMNYQEAYLPIVLIKAACFHNQPMMPVQAPSPKAPATAVATAIITLSMTLHFEDDFSLIIL
jgi:hypothetical protein